MNLLMDQRLSSKMRTSYRNVYIKSEVAFAFCHLLGFQLMPRLKNIYAQRLARPKSGEPEAYPNLQLILSRPIDWDLITAQYDQMIKYATALRLGTAETEAILRRFTQTGLKHPTYQAFAELYVRYNQGVRERSNPLSRPSLSYRRWPLKRVSFWEEATHEQSTLGVLPTGCRQRNGTSVVADPGTFAARSTNGRCLWARPERLPDLLCQTADCP